MVPKKNGYTFDKKDVTMKIEIAESLGAAWMKHVRKCFVVQQNWKVSPYWEESNEKMEHIKKMVYEFKKNLNAESLKKYDVFGASVVEQLISQTEIDVFGVSFGDNKFEFNALETAFHENGLQYGDKYKTASKVVSKMFRIAVTLYYYQNIKNGHIYFASPKITPATIGAIKPLFDKMSNFFKNEGFETEFKLIINNDFKREIVEPISQYASEISDSNELYLRAIQLERLFGLGGSMQTDGMDESNEKIGKVVQNEMFPLLQSNKVSESEIQDFLDLDESKAQFGLNYPLLMKRDDCDCSELRIRYYSQAIMINNEMYKVCSQWYAKSLGKVRSWIAQHSEDET